MSEWPPVQGLPDKSIWIYWVGPAVLVQGFGRFRGMAVLNDKTLPGNPGVAEPNISHEWSNVSDMINQILSSTTWSLLTINSPSFVQH